MKTIYRTLILLYSISLVQTANGQLTANLSPVEDGQVVTFGGGMGGHSYLKFDISSIPAGADIISVEFECNVKSMEPLWDGDAEFNNVNDQLWTVADMQDVVHALPKSDLTVQAAGFCTATGVNTSMDLTTIFMTDYSVGNTYCTLSISDPDDGTFAAGSFPMDNVDTLYVGNTSGFDQAMTFWSQEATVASLRPTLNVTYCVHTNSTLTETACDSFDLNSTIYTSDGVYTQIISNSIGCDSTIVLNLTINTVDATVTQNADTLTASTATATYQWIDCSDSTDVAGATGQSYTPTTTGDYACVVTENGCTDTSACFSVAISGIADSELSWIKLYPNPADEFINIQLDLESAGAVVRLLDASGKLISSHQTVSNQNLSIDISDFAAGIYLAEISANDRISRIRFVVK
jgi:hypothetical protein